MITKQLIMVGIHNETVDEKGNMITPASIIKIYEDDSTDCFDENIVASSEQIYARKNKKIDLRKVTVDDFKGSKGIQEKHPSVDSVHEFLEMIMEDGYKMIRMTRHKENTLADDLFKHVMRYGMSKANMAMNF